MGLQVEAVLASEDEISLEELLLDVWDVVTLLVRVLHGQSEVDDFYLVQEVFVVWYGFWHSNENVVELDVVEGVTGIVYESDLVKKLEADLVAAAGGEGFVTSE